MLFTKNMGPHLAMDEVALSADELYTIVTNKDAHGRKGALVAMVKGTRSEDVIKILKLIHKWQREQVVEMTVDLSPTMMLIAKGRDSQRPLSCAATGDGGTDRHTAGVQARGTGRGECHKDAVQGDRG